MESFIIRAFIVAEFIVLPAMLVLVTVASVKAGRHWSEAIPRAVIVAVLLAIGAMEWDTQNKIDSNQKTIDANQSEQPWQAERS